MNCWICGANANSGEHIIKASDLGSYFGEITQANPVFLHTDAKRNTRVGSKKSKFLHSKAPICTQCNNVRTQPYDVAWEKLAKYLLDNWKRIIIEKKFNLKKVFPGKANANAINIHLYFAKLFGFKIVEGNIPIEIGKFANAILNKNIVDNLSLIFGKTPIDLAGKHAIASNVNAINKQGPNGNQTEHASWCYVLGDLTVKVLYSRVPNASKYVGASWSPALKTKIIKIRKIK